MLRLLTGFALIAAAAAAPAQPAPPPIAKLMQDLAGDWTGALGYRDYQSGELFELPVKTSIRNVPDGVTQIRQSIFDEGAKKDPVWITTATIFDQDGAKLTYAGFRKGRPVELREQQLRLDRYESPTKWTVIYSEQGEDGDTKSDIRVTETLDGDTLKEVKEVRPLGDAKAEWKFRNQTVLKRVANSK
jgi:hypothetical protein